MVSRNRCYAGHLHLMQPKCLLPPSKISREHSSNSTSPAIFSLQLSSKISTLWPHCTLVPPHHVLFLRPLSYLPRSRQPLFRCNLQFTTEIRVVDTPIAFAPGLRMEPRVVQPVVPHSFVQELRVVEPTHAVQEPRVVFPTLAIANPVHAAR
jgi:hypothetical protein